MNYALISLATSSSLDCVRLTNTTFIFFLASYIVLKLCEKTHECLLRHAAQPRALPSATQSLPLYLMAPFVLNISRVPFLRTSMA